MVRLGAAGVRAVPFCLLVLLSTSCLDAAPDVEGKTEAFNVDGISIEIAPELKRAWAFWNFKRSDTDVIEGTVVYKGGKPARLYRYYC
jgi:hypothetical protein